MRLIKLWNEVCKAAVMVRSLPKSLLLNFYYLPFGQAIRLPILVSHRIKIRTLSGRVSLGRVKHGIVKVGFGGLGQDTGRQDGTWYVTGEIRFDGKARIGCGAKLFVDGKLELGDQFDASSNFILFCDESIRIGAENQLSWNVTLMDSDRHPIRDMEGHVVNPPAPITIGDRNWIGCDCLLLKGVAIGNGCVVAAGALVNRPHAGSHMIIGGQPARILKENVTWER